MKNVIAKKVILHFLYSKRTFSIFLNWVRLSKDKFHYIKVRTFKSVFDNFFEKSAKILVFFITIWIVLHIGYRWKMSIKWEINFSNSTSESIILHEDLFKVCSSSDVTIWIVLQNNMHCYWWCQSKWHLVIIITSNKTKLPHLLLKLEL